MRSLLLNKAEPIALFPFFPASGIYDKDMDVRNDLSIINLQTIIMVLFVFGVMRRYKEMRELPYNCHTFFCVCFYTLLISKVVLTLLLCCDNSA